MGQRRNPEKGSRRAIYVDTETYEFLIKKMGEFQAVTGKMESMNSTIRRLMGMEPLRGQTSDDDRR